MDTNITYKVLTKMYKNQIKQDYDSLEYGSEPAVKATENLFYNKDSTILALL